MHLIAKEEWYPFISNYLSNGWKQDNYYIVRIQYSEYKIKALVDITSYFLPKSGVYHFSVPLAFNIIAQLGIIHGCLDNKINKKSKEIYLREIKLKCSRKILKTRKIEIELAIKNKRIIDEGIFYTGSISIENSSFSGEAKYILPLK